MNKPEKILSGEGRENSTVEVVVKREAAEDVTELDLMRVFANMGKKRRIYAWVLIICLMIGLATPLLMAELSEKGENVSAVITFLYPEAKNQLAPDGSPLNMNILTSSYILQTALNNTKLSKEIPISAIERNITIENLLSEGTRQKLEVVQKISDESKDYGEVLNLEYNYEGRYIVSLTNGFSTDPEAKKKEYITGSELSNLLNNILVAYNEYFFETYSSFKLPENMTDSYSSENLDYIERLDNMVAQLNLLSRYCTDKEKSEYLDYRSETDGMSLLDLNDYIKLIKDIDIDYLYSFVYYNNVSKDIDSIITKFQYQLRTYQNSLTRILGNIADTSSLIQEYKNDSISVVMADQGTNQMSASVTDYYNRLIKAQVDYYSSKAELNTQIANTEYKINGFENSSSKQSNNNYVKNELSTLTSLCDMLYKMVAYHANEIINSNFYRNSYIDYIGAQYIADSFLSASTLKKAGIGAVVGLFAGILIWGMDGLIEELKYGSKKKENGGAES